jgi:hypothetical protein
MHEPLLHRYCISIARRQEASNSLGWKATTLHALCASDMKSAS